MALTKIFTGMENGPEKIDNNFNSLSADLGVFKVQDLVEYSGFTLSNGASWYSGSRGSIVTIELPNGFRVVTVTGVLKIASFSAAKNKTILTIPTKYAPVHEYYLAMPGSGTLFMRWTISAAGTMYITNATDEGALNKDSWYPISATYITCDH